ncbi:MAG: ABC transporter substrate-binding protein [Thermaerobacter sp.]|nr:ABC transporter substrate-binding protein [Thermaerobacter sp.]
MRRHSLSLVGSVIVGASLLLAGCGASTPTATVPSAPAKIGNTALVALPPQVSPNWWFPVMSAAACSVYNAQMNYLMYVPLLHVSKTDNIDYNRSLAKSVTPNASGTVYTIQLHHKWHWSNGSPVTSADVVWSAKLLLYASGSGSLPWNNCGTGIGGVPTIWQSVTANGPYQVVVTLNKPVNPVWFIHNGLGQIFPVPKSVWDIHKNLTNEMTFINSVANTPQSPYYNVVDGAFKYDAAASKPNNQYWSFVPNSSYDGHKASLSKLVFQYEASNTAEFSALKTGALNVGYLPYSMYADRTQLSNDAFFTTDVFGFNYAPFNFNINAPGGFGQIIKNRYARYALEMGVNQPAISQQLYHGYAVPEFGPIPATPKNQFNDPSITDPYPYNPAAGKKLLEANGWVMKNGVMTKGNLKFAFTMTYVAGSTSVKDISEILKTDWAKEGIQVTLQSQQFNSMITVTNQAKANGSKWSLNWWGGGWAYEPDFYPTGGGLFSSTGGANYGGYTSTTMDSLIKKTYESGTPSQVTSRLDAYQSWATQDAPVLWLPEPKLFNETALYVHGVEASWNPVLYAFFPNYWTVTH